jgi:hypothetical protein
MRRKEPAVALVTHRSSPHIAVALALVALLLCHASTRCVTPSLRDAPSSCIAPRDTPPSRLSRRPFAMCRTTPFVMRHPLPCCIVLASVASPGLCHSQGR